MKKKLALLGHGIRGSLSPLIHGAVFRKLEMEASYELAEISPVDFRSFVSVVMEEERFHGFNVTMPYKASILPFLDEIDGIAERCGAVNCVCLRDGSWMGFNTDSGGFSMSFREQVPSGTEKVGIVGNGGSAGAVLHALLEMEDVGEILVWGRNTEKSETMVERIATGRSRVGVVEDFTALEGCGVLVNCTPLTRFDIPSRFFPALGVFVDLKYHGLDPRFTAFLEGKGADFHDGKRMLLYQGVLSFMEWFPGKKRMDEMLDIYNQMYYNVIIGGKNPAVEL